MRPPDYCLAALVLSGILGWIPGTRGQVSAGASGVASGKASGFSRTSDDAVTRTSLGAAISGVDVRLKPETTKTSDVRLKPDATKTSDVRLNRDATEQTQVVQAPPLL